MLRTNHHLKVSYVWQQSATTSPAHCPIWWNGNSLQPWHASHCVAARRITLHIHTEHVMGICNAVTEPTNIPSAWVSHCFIAESSRIPVWPRWRHWLKCPKVFSDSWTTTETVAPHYGRLFLRPFETFYKYAVSFTGRHVNAGNRHLRPLSRSTYWDTPAIY